MPPLENPFNPPPLAVRASETSASHPIALTRGQTLVVVLEADVSTGFRWQAMPGYAPTLAPIGTSDLLARTTPPEMAARNDMVFRFQGSTPGVAALEFAYERPFESNVPPAKTVRYDVTVR